jgi:hypothetical protein
MRRDIKLMMDADEVWLLDGWQDSQGATMDEQEAEHLKRKKGR